MTAKPRVKSTRDYWLSCLDFTVRVEVNQAGTIIRTARVAYRFRGQPLEHLIRWMRSRGGFEMAEIGGG